MDDPTTHELFTSADVRIIILGVITFLFTYFLTAIAKRVWKTGLDLWARRSKSTAKRRLDKLERELNELRRKMEQPVLLITDAVSKVAEVVTYSTVAIIFFVLSLMLIMTLVLAPPSVKFEPISFFLTLILMMLAPGILNWVVSFRIDRVRRAADPEREEQNLQKRINSLRATAGPILEAEQAKEEERKA